MKTTLIALAAALAFSAVPAVHAQQLQENIPQVKVSSSFYVSPSELADYTNAYRLTNGQIVRFTQSGNRLYTQVDKGRRVRVIPVSNKEFISEEGARIVFRDYGDEVGISNFEKLPMAQILPANTMVVARR